MNYSRLFVKRCFGFAIPLALLCLSGEGLAETGFQDLAGKQEALVKAELIPEQDSIKPGRPLWVALNLEMAEGWHTYWKNPGDAGLATGIEWTLPYGFEAGPIEWPYPEKIGLKEIVNYGYTGEVTLLTRIMSPELLSPGAVVALEAKVKWLACHEICVPGGAEFQIKLTVTEEEPQPVPEWVMFFARAKARLPREPDDWTIRAASDERSFHIFMKPEGVRPPKDFDPVFFIWDQNLVRYAAPQRLRRLKDGYLLSIRKAPHPGADPMRFRGVLFSEKGFSSVEADKALWADVPLENYRRWDFLTKSSGWHIILRIFQLAVVAALLFAAYAFWNNNYRSGK